MTLLLEHAPHSDVSWWRDDFLPWMVGIATAVGVVAAILAGIFAALAYRREVLRDKARDDELRAAHAARVVAWFESDATSLRRQDLRLVRVAVDNTSDLPAYNTHIYWYLRSGSLESLLTALKEKKKPLPDWIQRVGHVRPGGKVDLGIDDDGIEALRRAWKPREPGSDEPDLGSLSFELRFHDAAGMAWSRQDNGDLEQRGRVR